MKLGMYEEHVYKVMKGGRTVTKGTMKECSASMGLAIGTIKGYSTPGHIQEAKRFGDQFYLEKTGEVKRTHDFDLAVYRGDDLISMGDPYDVAEEIGLSIENIWRRLRPSYPKPASNQGLEIIKIEKDDLY